MCEGLSGSLRTMKTGETCHKRHITLFLRYKLGEENKLTNNHRKEVQTKLKKGLLDMIILQYLNHKSMHGYKLITEISKDFGVYVGNGSIYPVLRILGKKAT